MKEPVKTKTQTKGVPELTAARLEAVTAILYELKMTLPDDVARVEIDIEYADGGRVKMEAKA